MTDGVGEGETTFGEPAPDSIRILHVDDDAAFLDLAAELLTRESSEFEVRSAESASEGRSILADERIDCVVSDFEMPGTDGLTFLEQVRERHPDLPFVLFTGKGSEEIASEAISAGVTDYLQKEPGTEQYAVLANRIEGYVARRRATDALGESRRRLDRLIGNLPGMVYRCANEPEWPMTFVSEGCEALTGYSAEDFTTGGVSWGRDVIHPEDRQPVWDDVQAAIDSGESFEVTYRIGTGDGEERLVWEQGSGVFSADGDLEALEGFITDVTEREVLDSARRELESELSETAQRLEAIVEASPAPIVAFDRERRVTLWNGAAEETFGWDADEVLGEPYPGVPETVDAHTSTSESAEPNGGVTELGEPSSLGVGGPDGSHYGDLKELVEREDVVSDVEVVGRTKDGERLTLWLSSAPLGDADGKETGRMAVLTDLTELREREREADFHRELVEKVGVGIGVYGEEGRFVYVNDRLAALVDRDVDDLVGEPIWEINPSFDPDRLEEYWDSVGPGETRTRETEFLEADGSSVPVETFITRGEIQGTPYHFGTIHDISKRLALDAELRETARRLEAVIEASPEAIVAVGPDGQVTLWNAAAGEFFGRTAEAAIGSPSSILPEEIAAVVEAQRGSSGPEETVTGVEVEFVDAGGDHVDVSISTAPLRASDDEIGGVMAVISDVGERKAHERTVTRLHEATRELMAAETPVDIARIAIDITRDVLEFPSAAVYFWDDDDGVLRLEHQSEGAADASLRPPSTADPEGQAIGHAYTSGETLVIDDLQNDDRASGNAIAKSACLIPMGRHGVYLVSDAERAAFGGRDVDIASILAANAEAALDRASREGELRRRERELQRQNERLERFASVLSHDLRNPLTVAIGRVELLEEDTVHQREISRALERMGAIVDDVLAVTRHGRIVEDPEPVDAVAVVRDAWSTVDTAAATLECLLERTISADPDRLARLFENVFRNAVEHGGADVHVRVGPIGGGFFVEDDGPGIPSHERERVFELGHTTAESGTGLGLPIVMEIVEAHGWSIEVTSGRDGGARFEVTGIDRIEE